MAINQNKYINIGSNIVRFATGQRDLSGLVITNVGMLSGASSDSRYALYNSGKIVKINSVEDAVYLFGASVSGTPSEMHEFAKCYFAYVSPNGRTAQHLYVMKDTTGTGTQKASDALLGEAVAQGYTFGSFTFLDSNANSPSIYTAAWSKAAYTSNAAIGNQFLAVHCLYGTTSDIATMASTATSTSASGLAGIDGLHIRASGNKYGSAFPMAILASTDYNLPNSAQCFMYKQSAAETAFVTNDTDYATLVNANVNFYGQTQVNGAQLSFYQRGVNIDGVDTGVYCNEIWLKSEIAQRFFNLVTNVSKIPANYVGEGMIVNCITPSLTRAINNGSILIGKSLSEEKRIQIANFTGSDEAADMVEADGYWLKVVISDDDSDGEYDATYILAYSRGDAVRFISGTHDIV